MTIAGTHPPGNTSSFPYIWVHVRHVPVVFGLEKMQHTVAIENHPFIQCETPQIAKLV